MQDDGERMIAGCDHPLPEAARAAVALFNAGEYYAQHDAFEALWREERGPVRDLYRAVLQVGVGYYQITRGNERGAWKMLMRAERWLARLPDACQGVDLAALRTAAAAVRLELERRARMVDPPPFDLTLLQPVRMIDD